MMVGTQEATSGSGKSADIDQRVIDGIADRADIGLLRARARGANHAGLH